MILHRREPHSVYPGRRGGTRRTPPARINSRRNFPSGGGSKNTGCLMVAGAVAVSGALMLAGQWHALTLVWLVYLHLTLRRMNCAGRSVLAE